MNNIIIIIIVITFLFPFSAVPYEIDQTHLTALRESKCINTLKSCRALLPIVTPSMGNCVLDSVSMENCGRFDRDFVERNMLHQYLLNCPAEFKERWKLQQEIYNFQDDFSLEPDEWIEEWDIIVSLASNEFKKGTKMLHCLESVHIFALANIYKRTIIVIANDHDAINKYCRFGGIYLPILNKPMECDKNPIIIAYNQAHFTALVASTGSEQMIYPIENDKKGLMAMPYSTVTNKKRMSKGQKLKVLQQFLDLTSVCENRYQYTCAK